MAERLLWEQEAAGSNPVTPIRKRLKLRHLERPPVVKSLGGFLVCSACVARGAGDWCVCWAVDRGPVRPFRPFGRPQIVDNFASATGHRRAAGRRGDVVPRRGRGGRPGIMRALAGGRAVDVG